MVKRVAKWDGLSVLHWTNIGSQMKRFWSQSLPVHALESEGNKPIVQAFTESSTSLICCWLL